jgi:cytochrome c oxidase subunit 2
MIEFLGLPPEASAHAAAIDSLIGNVHWLMFVLFVGWGGFFLFTLMRFRRKAHPKADYVGVKSHTSTYLEIAVAVVEVVLLVGFSIPLWAKVVVTVPDAKDATVVRVIAEQFLWNVHYPGADGVFGRTDPKLIDTQSNPLGLDRDDPSAKDDITTINQLHLPIDKPVLIHLSSKDVIHSLSLPIMRVKQDAIPGMVIPVGFTPIVTGESEIACAQLCGLGHYRMRGFVTVHTQAEYEKWLAENAPVPAEPEMDEMPADTAASATS